METFRAYKIFTEQAYGERPRGLLGFARGNPKEIKEYFKDRNLEILTLEPIEVKYFSGDRAYWVFEGPTLTPKELGYAIGTEEEIKNHFKYFKNTKFRYDLRPIKIKTITAKAVKERHRMLKEYANLKKIVGELEKKLYGD